MHFVFHYHYHHQRHPQLSLVLITLWSGVFLLVPQNVESLIKLFNIFYCILLPIDNALFFLLHCIFAFSLVLKETHYPYFHYGRKCYMCIITSPTIILSCSAVIWHTITSIIMIHDYLMEMMMIMQCNSQNFMPTANPMMMIAAGGGALVETIFFV